MEVVDLLINGSPMAAFAVFLIYLYKTQQARMDNLVDKFQQQLEGIRKEYKADVEELRGRYDSVIAGYTSEAKDTRDSVSDKLTEVISDLRKVGTDLSTLYISHETNSDELQEIGVKVDQGIKMMQAMQEEARLKELARSAAQRERGE